MKYLRRGGAIKCNLLQITSTVLNFKCKKVFTSKAENQFGKIRKSSQLLEERKDSFHIRKADKVVMFSD